MRWNYGWIYIKMSPQEQITTLITSNMSLLRNWVEPHSLGVFAQSKIGSLGRVRMKKNAEHFARSTTKNGPGWSNCSERWFWTDPLNEHWVEFNISLDRYVILEMSLWRQSVELVLAADPQPRPNDPGCESACSPKPHPPSPFIITQPESWYSFYHPTESRRLELT